MPLWDLQQRLTQQKERIMATVTGTNNSDLLDALDGVTNGAELDLRTRRQ